MLNKLGISVLIIIAPLQIALMGLIAYQFRLAYLTHEKDKQYHRLAFAKILAALGLIGFLEVRSWWAYGALLIYFTSDALLTRNNVRTRSATVKALTEEKPRTRRYVPVLNEKYLRYFVPVACLCLFMVYVSYERAEFEHTQERSNLRYAHAEKTRQETSKNVKTIAEKAGEFIDLATDYFRYQVSANADRTARLKRIEVKLGLTPMPENIIMPKTLDSLTTSEMTRP